MRRTLMGRREALPQVRKARKRESWRSQGSALTVDAPLRFFEIAPPLARTKEEKSLTSTSSSLHSLQTHFSTLQSRGSGSQGSSRLVLPCISVACFLLYLQLSGGGGAGGASVDAAAAAAAASGARRHNAAASLTLAVGRRHSSSSQRRHHPHDRKISAGGSTSTSLRSSMAASDAAAAALRARLLAQASSSSARSSSSSSGPAALASAAGAGAAVAAVRAQQPLAAAGGADEVVRRAASGAAEAAAAEARTKKAAAAASVLQRPTADSAAAASSGPLLGGASPLTGLPLLPAAAKRNSGGVLPAVATDRRPQPLAEPASAAAAAEAAFLSATLRDPVDPTPPAGSGAASPDEARRLAVRSAMAHSWAGYVAHAWGADELAPVTKHGYETFCSLGVREKADRFVLSLSLLVFFVLASQPHFSFFIFLARESSGFPGSDLPEGKRDAPRVWNREWKQKTDDFFPLET